MCSISINFTLLRARNFHAPKTARNK